MDVIIDDKKIADKEKIYCFKMVENEPFPTNEKSRNFDQDSYLKIQENKNSSENMDNFEWNKEMISKQELLSNLTINKHCVSGFSKLLTSLQQVIKTKDKIQAEILRNNLSTTLSKNENFTNQKILQIKFELNEIIQNAEVLVNSLLHTQSDVCRPWSEDDEFQEHILEAPEAFRTCNEEPSGKGQSDDSGTSLDAGSQCREKISEPERLAMERDHDNRARPETVPCGWTNSKEAGTCENAITNVVALSDHVSNKRDSNELRNCFRVGIQERKSEQYGEHDNKTCLRGFSCFNEEFSNKLREKIEDLYRHEEKSFNDSEIKEALGNDGFSQNRFSLNMPCSDIHELVTNFKDMKISSFAPEETYTNEERNYIRNFEGCELSQIAENSSLNFKNIRQYSSNTSENIKLRHEFATVNVEIPSEEDDIIMELLNKRIEETNSSLKEMEFFFKNENFTFASCNVEQSDFKLRKCSDNDSNLQSSPKAENETNVFFGKVNLKLIPSSTSDQFSNSTKEKTSYINEFKENTTLSQNSEESSASFEESRFFLSAPEDTKSIQGNTIVDGCAINIAGPNIIIKNLNNKNEKLRTYLEKPKTCEHVNSAINNIESIDFENRFKCVTKENISTNNSLAAMDNTTNSSLHVDKITEIRGDIKPTETSSAIYGDFIVKTGEYVEGVCGTQPESATGALINLRPCINKVFMSKIENKDFSCGDVSEGTEAFCEVKRCIAQIEEICEQKLNENKSEIINDFLNNETVNNNIVIDEKHLSEERNSCDEIEARISNCNRNSEFFMQSHQNFFEKLNFVQDGNERCDFKNNEEHHKEVTLSTKTFVGDNEIHKLDYCTYKHKKANQINDNYSMAEKDIRLPNQLPFFFLNFKETLEEPKEVTTLSKLQNCSKKDSRTHDEIKRPGDTNFLSTTLNDISEIKEKNYNFSNNVTLPDFIQINEFAEDLKTYELANDSTKFIDNKLPRKGDTVNIQSTNTISRNTIELPDKVTLDKINTKLASDFQLESKYYESTDKKILPRRNFEFNDTNFVINIENQSAHALHIAETMDKTFPESTERNATNNITRISGDEMEGILPQKIESKFINSNDDNIIQIYDLEDHKNLKCALETDEGNDCIKVHLESYEMHDLGNANSTYLKENEEYIFKDSKEVVVGGKCNEILLKTDAKNINEIKNMKINNVEQDDALMEQINNASLSNLDFRKNIQNNIELETEGNSTKNNKNTKRILIDNYGFEDRCKTEEELKNREEVGSNFSSHIGFAFEADEILKISKNIEIINNKMINDNEINIATKENGEMRTIAIGDNGLNNGDYFKDITSGVISAHRGNNDTKNFRESGIETNQNFEIDSKNLNNIAPDSDNSSCASEFVIVSLRDNGKSDDNSAGEYIGLSTPTTSERCVGTQSKSDMVGAKVAEIERGLIAHETDSVRSTSSEDDDTGRCGDACATEKTPTSIDSAGVEHCAQPPGCSREPTATVFTALDTALTPAYLATTKSITLKDDQKQPKVENYCRGGVSNLSWGFRNGRLVFDVDSESFRESEDELSVLKSKNLNKKSSERRLKFLEDKLKEAGITDGKYSEDNNKDKQVDENTDLAHPTKDESAENAPSISKEDSSNSSKVILRNFKEILKNSKQETPDSKEDIKLSEIGLQNSSFEEEEELTSDSSGEDYFPADLEDLTNSFCEFDVQNIHKFQNSTSSSFFTIYDELEEEEEEKKKMRGDGSMGTNVERKQHNPDRGNLKSLLKKPGRNRDLKKNRVVFNETKNEFFDADYIILIREECDYDEEDDDGICTCNQHEMVRLTCCEPNCNCNVYDGYDPTPQSPKFAPPLEFVDAVTLSPPEEYKDMELEEQQLLALQQMARRGQRSAVCRECSASHEDEGDGSQSDNEEGIEPASDDHEDVEEKEKTDQSQQTTPTTPPAETDTNEEGQRYIMETLTMTTVSERQIIKEAEEKTQTGTPTPSLPLSGSPISGILKGGRLWKQASSEINNTRIVEPQQIDSSITSDEEGNSKRSVRFIETQDSNNQQRDVCDGAPDKAPEEGLSKFELNEDETISKTPSIIPTAANFQGNGTISASPESTEMMLTFKLGNHVLISNNSLKPNSAVRQLFPCTKPLPGKSEETDPSGHQYLVTAESLKAFEEAKRSKLPQIIQSGDTDDSIRRAIERNTLRRSLIRYEPKTRKVSQKTDNSLVERIKQLTCDVEEDINQESDDLQEQQRASPPGEEARNSPEVAKINSHDKSFSPSSSSTASSNSSSMSSTYKKLTDLFAKRDKPDIQNIDQPKTLHLSSAPDLGNGPQEFADNPPPIVAKINTSSEPRKQFLSTLAPLTACVSAMGTADDYYHINNHNHGGERNSMTSSVGTEYSLEDIDEVLRNDEEETKKIAPDVLAGTPSASESGDELAIFVQQDAGRIERIKKKYQPEATEEDDEHDDYGFNRRPSVRGIKPRFGSTTEILQQIQNQMQPPSNTQPRNHVAWPYYSETNLTSGIDNTKTRNINQNGPPPYQYPPSQTPEDIKRNYAAHQYRPTNYIEENLYQNCANQRCAQVSYRTNMNVYPSVVRVGGGCSDYYASLPRNRNGRPQSPPPQEVSKNYHQTMVYIPYNHIEGYHPVSPNPYYSSSDACYARVTNQNQINKRFVEATYQRIEDHYSKPVLRQSYNRSESPQFSTARSTQTPAPNFNYYPPNTRFRPMVPNGVVWQDGNYVTKVNRHSFPLARYPPSDSLSLTDSDSQHSNGYRETTFGVQKDSMPNSPTKTRYIERGVPEGAASVSPQDSITQNSSTMTSPTSPQNPQTPGGKPLFYAMNV